MSLHMDEPHDWPQIAALYGELARLTGSPIVELNRAIAEAEAQGPEAGLARVDRLDLDGYQYFHSTRADLLRRLGRADEARSEYERALELAHTETSASSWSDASQKSVVADARLKPEPLHRTVPSNVTRSSPRRTPTSREGPDEASLTTKSDRRRWLVLAVTVAAQFMVIVYVSVVNVALPATADLHSPRRACSG